MQAVAHTIHTTEPGKLPNCLPCLLFLSLSLPPSFSQFLKGTERALKAIELKVVFCCPWKGRAKMARHWWRTGLQSSTQCFQTGVSHGEATLTAPSGRRQTAASATEDHTLNPSTGLQSAPSLNSNTDPQTERTFWLIYRTASKIRFIIICKTSIDRDN